MSKYSTRARCTLSDEFTQAAIDTVEKQKYSLMTVVEAVNESSRSLREWNKKLAPEL